MNKKCTGDDFLVEYQRILLQNLDSTPKSTSSTQQSSVHKPTISYLHNLHLEAILDTGYACSDQVLRSENNTEESALLMHAYHTGLKKIEEEGIKHYGDTLEYKCERIKTANIMKESILTRDEILNHDTLGVLFSKRSVKKQIIPTVPTPKQTVHQQQQQQVIQVDAESYEEAPRKNDFQSAKHLYNKDQKRNGNNNTFQNKPQPRHSSNGDETFNPVKSLPLTGYNDKLANEVPVPNKTKKFVTPFKTPQPTATATEQKTNAPPAKKRKVDGESSTTTTNPVLVKLFGSDTIPEDLQHLDVKLIEMIASEILNKDVGIRWTDIAGLEGAKKAVMEAVIWPMLRPDIFHGIRAPPKGLLLFGPPGTGKTLIGKAIATESNATFFTISASSLVSKWVGEGERLVRTLFSVARYLSPSVIFVDEIDSLLSQRSEGDADNGTRRLKTEFLVQVDGVGTGGDNSRVLLVGATNRPEELDEAVRRRLVKRLYVPLPTDQARHDIIRNLLDKSKSNYSLDQCQIERIIEMTRGFSGSDMSALVNESALGPIRDVHDIMNIDAANVRPIALCDFEAAMQQIRPSVSEKDIGRYLQWNESFGSFG
ncbi:hypothetical protein AKO1_010919 [Acrasis kona]|uniref:AAA+ ATPase domain-containing protein n=1 Tax=Acrasis kona TaxID=1008807 RepID=A0AAW2YSH6_9EUKA